MLRSHGFINVLQVQDARKIFSKHHKLHSDLIILDLNMPHMNGFEILEALKAQKNAPLPPIIVLTAQHSKLHQQQALSLGADMFVTKPFDLKEMMNSIETLLEKKH